MSVSYCLYIQTVRVGTFVPVAVFQEAYLDTLCIASEPLSKTQQFNRQGFLDSWTSPSSFVLSCFQIGNI